MAGLVVGGLVAVAPVVASPLGRLGPPFALLIVLPTLALALESFGWSRAAAGVIRRLGHPVARLVGAYAVWLGTSALLTLDVSAAAGASVGIEAAGPDPSARRWHLGAVVLGSNVGSLLFPFSNLTNLVVLGATGIGLAAFVETSWAPQVGAAVVIGALLALRARRSGDLPHVAPPADAPPAVDPARSASERPVLVMGAVALVGAIGAIGAGLAGLDMAMPFALSGGLLAGAAVAERRLDGRSVARAIPYGALALVAAAALVAGPVSSGAGFLPHPVDDLAGLTFALVAGGLIAASVNNLPAAAFGAAWLAHAAAPVVVAYLIGTNVAAIATPHGSAATMLVRSGGARRGSPVPVRAHLRGAWPYALAGSVVAVGLLAVVR